MRQKFLKAIISLTMCIAILVLVSCSNSTPEGLAKECCDCYKKVKSYKNDDRREEKLQECMTLTQTNLATLRQMGIDNDWSKEQVDDAQKRFDTIYSQCAN